VILITSLFPSRCDPPHKVFREAYGKGHTGVRHCEASDNWTASWFLRRADDPVAELRTGRRRFDGFDCLAAGAARANGSGFLLVLLDRITHSGLPLTGDRRMKEQFESLESAHGFVALLAETVAEAKRELTNDVEREAIPSRRRDTLHLALYNLQKLELHVNRTSRILNDLRTLRRLLFEERGLQAAPNAAQTPTGQCIAA
jgi:hypothetical protein